MGDLAGRESKMAQVVGKVGASLGRMGAGLQKATVPRLQKFWKYAAVELKPPTPAEFPAVSAGFSNLMKSAATGKYKQVTVKQAWVNTLVTIEIACWFFVGECIGKRSIVGYQIPGAVNFDAHV